MARLSATSRLLASSMALAGCAAAVTASLASATTMLLGMDDARSPELVAEWLRVNAQNADKKTSAWYFEQGERAGRRGNWSAAAKAFGESMIRYPRPRTLAAYARADLKMLGAVRKREKAPPEMVVEDMKYFLGYYEASIAADGVSSELNAKEREEIRADIACVKAYVETRLSQARCLPLRYFFDKP